MNILVINCGSSSLKYQLIDMKNENVLAKGLVERIGIEGSQIKHETIGKDEVKIQEAMKDHKRALELVLNSLTDKNYGAIASLDEIHSFFPKGVVSVLLFYRRKEVHLQVFCYAEAAAHLHPEMSMPA